VELSKGNASNLYNTYSSALKAARGIAVRSGSTINCPAIIWMQGEDDYTRETAPTKEQYLSDLVHLKNDMQNDVVAKYGQEDIPFFYTYQCGTQYTRGRELNVGMAQLEASNQNADIICVGPAYPVTDVGGHLDANGSRWYGEMIGKVYHKTHVLGEDFKPLQPKKLLRDAANPKKVIIRFLVPTMPLVLDSLTLDKVADYGFEVYNNNARQTINSVTILDENVIITCAADLTGRIEVVYAGLNASRRGHGNLRDSDGEKGFFNYIDPNLKDENDEYVYPHYDNLTSYTPNSGEPKDEDGNVIYDKPYPLYNFSVAFYYAIPEGEDSYEVPELNIAVSFTAVQTGGVSGVSNSAGIELTFDRTIENLTAEHIVIEDGTGKAVKGDVLSGSGNTYTIALADVTEEGNVLISVNHPGYNITSNPQEVDVFTALHTVTVVSDGDNASGGGRYLAGATVTIDAGTAPAGHFFSQWTSNPEVVFEEATSAITRFTMPGEAVTVTASFQPGTGIGASQTDGLRTYVQGGVLRLSGLVAGNTWSVYTLSGMLVYQATAGEAEASVALPVRGAYIVKIQTDQEVQLRKIILQ
jgi:hypothetical protein